MIVAIGSYEWDIPSGSMLQEKQFVYEWQKYRGAKKLAKEHPKEYRVHDGVLEKNTLVTVWIDMFEIKEKVSAEAAINMLKGVSNRRILSPGEVIITRSDRWRCTNGSKELNRAVIKPNSQIFDDECGGFLAVEGKHRVCEKCRAKYEYLHSERAWVRHDSVQFSGSFIKRETDYAEKLNDKMNQFNMVTTGSKHADNVVIRKSPKSVFTDRKVTLFDGNDFRTIKIEHVGIKIKIIEIGDIVDPKEGDIIARYVSKASGRMLKINVLSSTPTDATFHEVIS